jgi:hypothetical protein
MKKIFFAAAVSVFVSFTTRASEPTLASDRGSESKRQLRKEKREERKMEWLHYVDPVTESNFYADFPGASDVSWTQGAFVEASFVRDGVEKVAYYDSDRNLVGTTQIVEFSSLPASAQKVIRDRYPDYTVEKVVLYEDNQENDTDMYLFDAAFEDQDNYFPVLSRGNKEIILKVTMGGDVSFFQNNK